MRKISSRHAVIGKEVKFVVVTGLSGAGKSEAIRALEDLGYFCVDNLPVALISTLAGMIDRPQSSIKKAAVVVDMRDPNFLEAFESTFESVKEMAALAPVLLFLEANDAVLVRRFSETRRPHPFGTDQVLDGILKEREGLEEVKKLADKVFDTSELTVHELRRLFMDLSLGGPDKQLLVTLLSFGYKHGVPLESDLLFDVRFLPNPYFVSELRSLTGRDAVVRDYIGKATTTKQFLEKITGLLRFLVPEYASEGKSYLTVGIGCTGGRHRSVMVAENLNLALPTIEGVRFRVRHRDIFSE